MFAFWSLIAGALQGAATGCHSKVLVFEGSLGFGAFLMVPLQGAAARCCRQTCLCFGVWLLVQLQGAAARWCCQSAVCALELGCWSCRRVPLQSAAERHCCQSAVCALEFCWLWRALQGAAVKGLFLLWSLVPGADAKVLVQGAAAGRRFRMPLLWNAARVFFAIWGLRWRNLLITRSGWIHPSTASVTELAPRD